MQNLTFYDGETLTMAMPPGDYYLQREDGTQIGFRLAQNASLRMVGSNGWTDGEGRGFSAAAMDEASERRFSYA